MTGKIAEIAGRVREMREVRGLTSAEMARRLGMDEGEYRACESAEADIPASKLVEMAEILDVETSLLLSGTDPKLGIFSVTRRDKGIRVERRKAYSYMSLAANFIGKRAEPFLVTAEPGADGGRIELNVHPGQEFDYVLEGSLKVTIHGNDIVLGQGDSIFFDSGYPHAIRAEGDVPARFVAVIL